MARRMRLPLLLALAVLTAMFVLLPVPASAFTPTCPNGVGHYGPAGCSELWQGSCRVGTICFTWDCIVTDGVLHPTNVQQIPSFCMQPPGCCP
jgi:hypothetical protein